MRYAPRTTLLYQWQSEKLISEPLCPWSTATQNEGVTSARSKGFSEPFEDFSDKRLSESKITTPVLGWLEDSVIRSDSPAVGVAESFSTCVDIWIVW